MSMKSVWHSRSLLGLPAGLGADRSMLGVYPRPLQVVLSLGHCNRASPEKTDDSTKKTPALVPAAAGPRRRSEEGVSGFSDRALFTRRPALTEADEEESL